MKILSIDPGNEQSAWLIYDTETDYPIAFSKDDNDSVLATITKSGADQLAIEMVASYGMPVGREVFDTCVWIGRFIERWGNPETVERVYRKDVKMNLCRSMRAKDSNIRAALIDRFGPGKDRAVGTVKRRGPLYGIGADVWSALAVAVTWLDAERAKA